MPLCPNGNAIIEWQYSGEEKQQILGADDYSIQQAKGQCPIKYTVSWITNVFGSNTQCNSYTAVSFGAYSVWGPVSGVIFKNPRGNCGAYGEMYLLCHGISSQPRKVNQTEFLIASFTTLGRFRNVINYQVVPENNQLDNCAFLFQITKNGQVVYSKISPQSPSVTHHCDEQCPPGTCECTNGSTVCCYDANTGIAVKSFTR
jgi:hypothetical protein